MASGMLEVIHRGEETCPHELVGTFGRVFNDSSRAPRVQLDERRASVAPKEAK